MEGLKCTEGTLQSLDVGSTEEGLNPRSVTDELGTFDVALNLSNGVNRIYIPTEVLGRCKRFLQRVLHTVVNQQT